MKKLLPFFCAVLALTAASVQAKIAYYYGTGSLTELDSGGGVFQGNYNVLAVVEVDSHQVQFIQISATPAGSFYTVSSVQNFSLVSITGAGANPLSYSFISQTNNLDSSGTTNQQQLFLYGANSTIDLGGTSGSRSIPASISGTANTIVSGNSGFVALANYNLSLLLPLSTPENKNNHTLAQSVASAKNVLEGLGIHPAP